MRTTRERILAHLKREPAASVDVLSHALELAPMTIRQQLAKMTSDGLIEAESERRPTGRPAHVYSLTPKGDEGFPKAYDRLAAILLEEITVLEPGDLEGLSPAGRRSMLFRRIATRAAAPYRADLERLSGRERAEAATAILHSESGFTELEVTSVGVEIREYNCVYQRVAEGHNDVCSFHTEYVSELVGASVVLDGCQCEGAKACRFLVAL